ncbi:MAG: hypothetical protein M1828_006843 [Chrysothrix sp. TS-e1954]|nr:MAG: hypothetical protein M1828_006843 [Chrysothrix sp. TS-e1954]
MFSSKASLVLVCLFALGSAVSRPYYLRVEVFDPIVNPPHTHFNATYIQPYHTGAGLNDVVLSPQENATFPGFLNGTQQQFHLPAEDGYPWSLELNTLVEYTGWSPAVINIGDGNSYGAFYLSQAGELLYNTAGTLANPRENATTDNEFGGWLVCDWWHGVAELFWLNAFFDRGLALPRSCAYVNLLAEYTT